jgi:anti-sigma B factor antagonist
MAEIKPSISIQYIEQAIVLTLSDRQILEEKNIRILQESMVSVIDECEGIHLVLDFCNVEFLSSAVLGLLIRVSKRVHESNGKIRLCSINPKIYEVFRITQLTKVFDIHRDIDDALASFD